MTICALSPARGKAGEYATYQCNLAIGCVYACRYCYARRTCRKSVDEWMKPVLRTGILETLGRNAAQLAACGDRGPVLLSFLCDPYQPGVDGLRELRQEVITTLCEWDMDVSILTKNPYLAWQEDGDLIVQHAGRVEVGTTLVSMDDDFLALWEPRAASWRGRSDGLRMFRQAGVRTWLSVEPVIRGIDALSVIQAGAGRVSRMMIGKLNHHPVAEATDWAWFVREAARIMHANGQRWYFKQSLWDAAGGDAAMGPIRQSTLDGEVRP